MNIMKRILFSTTILATLVCLFLAPARTSAQQSNSLYFLENTPFHTKWNPAMAPSRSGVGIGVSNLAFSLNSDLAFNDIFQLSPDGTHLITFLHRDADKTGFLNGLSNISNIGISSAVDILNLGLRFGNLYLTFGSSVITDVSIGLPKDLFNLVMLGVGTGDDSRDLSSLNANGMVYAKTGAGVSLKLGDMFTVGATANYLSGLAYMRLGFDQLSVSGSTESFDISTKGDLYISNQGTVTLGYDQDGYLNNFSYFDEEVKPIGQGMSFDFGLTFKPLNFLTLSAAVLDLGSITWNKENIGHLTSDETFTYEGADLNETGGIDFDMDDIDDLLRMQEITNVSSLTSKLTTKINIGAEVGLPNNKLSLGVLSQTGIDEDGNYQDYMVSANLKPGKMLQAALTYSLLHGELSSFGAAINLKLLFLNLFVAADYIPLKVTPQHIPVNNSYFNVQTGLNLMF
jgi:hypothetical protein